MNEKITPPVEQDDATLEKVTGGSLEFATALYRCPKCGREGRQTVLGGARTQKCLFCMVNMEMVDDTVQQE